MKSNTLLSYAVSLILTLVFSNLLQYNFNMNFLYSIIILVVAFGLKDTLAYIFIILINLVVMKIFKTNVKRYVFIINLLLVSICGYYYKIYSEKKSQDICGPLMVLIIRLYYLSKENIINFKDAINYLFFVPVVLAGPSVPYTQFKERRNIRKEIGYIKITNSIAFLLIHLSLQHFFKLENTYKLSSFILSFINAFIVCFAFRCKFYFIWNFASGCCEIAGYEFNNINAINAETSKSVKDLTSNWNIYTNIWLKESVFDELKWTSNLVASLATFSVSALWHGTNICYFLIFLSLSLAVLPLKNNYKMIKYYFNKNVADIVALITVSSYVTFTMVPFIALDYKVTLKVWRNLYYYGYLYLIISYILIFFNKKEGKKKE
ncbi:putative membrane bound O-acyl transferase [Spraguea lophii 42_110]|uniref:Putative membrane bound O-acyl transferase n=1 Tax=Spraguea lophii (strain 42_110) TaxID=1358809 RepID=S7W9S9_SPRLO|nr:putative membrane bound O-acyl transferase [Spraguea lophii 42_110]